MPFTYRVRRDVVDLRPIHIRPGPSFYNYYWKVMTLLDLNEKGEFVLPFSRRLAHTNRLLWPRSDPQPPPLGYELCGCINCESKSYTDHILNNYDDDDDPECGNIHLEEVYIDSDDEKDEEEKETSTMNSQRDAENEDNAQTNSWSVSTASNGHIDGSGNSESDDTDNDCDELCSNSTFPLLGDPFESFDYEC